MPVLMPDVFEDQGALDIADTSITAGSSITMAAETEIEPEPDEEIALPMETGKVPQQISDNIDVVMTEWALGFWLSREAHPESLVAKLPALQRGICIARCSRLCCCPRALFQRTIAAAASAARTWP